MKCRSIATLWSASPPHHKPTLTALSPTHSALFTASSDGSLLWWALPVGNLTSPDPFPMAILSGHAAAVVAVVPVPIPTGFEVFSVCRNGVMCVWSGGSGRCRRRRDLPEWTGMPFAAVGVGVGRREVCVGCGEGLKVVVFVVDLDGLGVVRVVFEGELGLRELRFVAVVEDEVVVGDAVGNVVVVGGEESEGKMVCFEGSVGENVVSVGVFKGVLVAVFRRKCVFKWALSGAVVGEIDLVGSPLWSCEDEVGFDGCVMLEDGFDGSDFPDGVAKNVVVWNSRGLAMVFAGRFERKEVGVKMCFEPLFVIPKLADVRNVVGFCKLERCVLRVESVCSEVRGSAIWRPHITVWSCPEVAVQNHNLCFESGELNSHSSLCSSTLLGEGGFDNYACDENAGFVVGSDEREREVDSFSGQAIDASSTKESGKASEISTEITNEQNVSSSMVLSEDTYAPYAVIYGYYSGHIEVTHFWNSLLEPNSAGEIITKQTLFGHSDAVLCLAAHRTTAMPNGRTRQWLLVSGGLDCTIRIWDLDSGSVLWVCHHHVAPVRQIILPPPMTDHPWGDCFLSVGDDGCVALISLQTLKVERMFPGHPCYTSKVVWDGSRGYVACLCQNIPALSDSRTALYMWDVKTGARDRVVTGATSYSIFDSFCRGINVNSVTGNVLGGSTSASLLHLPVTDDSSPTNSHIRVPPARNSERRNTESGYVGDSLLQGYKPEVPIRNLSNTHGLGHDAAGNRPARQASLHSGFHKAKHPIKCFSPFPGIASLKFDLASLTSPCHANKDTAPINDKLADTPKSHEDKKNVDSHQQSAKDACSSQGAVDFLSETVEENWIRFSLAFLHFWGVDLELDKLLIDDMKIQKPEGLFISSGILGDRGSMMLTFPGLRPTLELWKSSSEFCAMRSLTIVSLAQRLITLSHSSLTASSVLAAFYTRNFAEKVPNIKPPSLQLLISFWQDPSEHVRMAARSLFHCAVPRAIPRPIYCKRESPIASPIVREHVIDNCSSSGQDTSGRNSVDANGFRQSVEADIAAWLESYEMQDWISFIGGTTQDSKCAHIILAAALAVWYPSVVKSELAIHVVSQLTKLVMSANDVYSSTAAELLAEGMESTWKVCIGPEIPQLIADIFFQIECLSAANKPKQSPASTINIRETLVAILLPSLAMADIPGFLNVIERQLWVTSSDSPIHLVSVVTLIRVIRGSPKALAPYLDEVIDFVLQTIDYANLIMRNMCLQSSMAAIKEVARVFPMVTLNDTTTRLAIGDAIGDIHTTTIRVYDLQSIAKIKVLDARAPPGLPTLLSEALDTTVSTGISAASFSPDGEGLVAFSEQGLVIRWWSLGIAWWEKLSRTVTPVQCTKLIFVPPWEGFSPNSSRTSIMAHVGHDNKDKSREKAKEPNDADRLQILIQNLDLSYKLEWIDERKVLLTRHGRALGSFQF